MAVSISPNQLIFEKNKESLQHLRIDCRSQTVFRASSNAPNILKFKSGLESFGRPLNSKEIVVLAVTYTPGVDDIDNVVITIEVKTGKFKIPVKFLNDEKKLSSIECEICREEFNSEDRIPRILNSCGHCLCQTCASKMIKDKEIKCAECREITRVENDVTSLLKNFGILNLLDASEENIKTKPVVQQKIELEQKPKEKVVKPEDAPKCPNHPKEIAKYFCTSPDCTTTDKVMCYQCIDEDGKHEGHSSEPIRKWIERQGFAKCEKLLEDIHQKKLNLRWQIGKLDRDRAKFYEKSKSENEKIFQIFVEKIRELQQLQTEAASKISEYVGLKNARDKMKGRKFIEDLEYLEKKEQIIEKLMSNAGKSKSSADSFSDSIKEISDFLENFGEEDESSSSDDQLPNELFTLTDDFQLIINQ